MFMLQALPGIIFRTCNFLQGYFQIVNVGSNKCLNVDDNSFDESASVILYDCIDGARNELFYIGDGRFPSFMELVDDMHGYFI